MNAHITYVNSCEEYKILQNRAGVIQCRLAGFLISLIAHAYYYTTAQLIIQNKTTMRARYYPGVCSGFQQEGYPESEWMDGWMDGVTEWIKATQYLYTYISIL